jgi:two-component system capsular synthesis sensor histidine kinase RcsC
METQHALVSNDVRVRGSVIIVDDDEPTCHLLADCVRLLGFDVQIATSATQALAMMRAHPVNVAVCDIVMPGYDGVWLINRIRREFPRTAVVVATGLAKIDPTLAMAPCVAAHVVKPFDFDDIAEALGSAIAVHSELQ